MFRGNLRITIHGRLVVLWSWQPSMLPRARVRVCRSNSRALPAVNSCARPTRRRARRGAVPSAGRWCRFPAEEEGTEDRGQATASESRNRRARTRKRSSSTAWPADSSSALRRLRRERRGSARIAGRSCGFRQARSRPRLHLHRQRQVSLPPPPSHRPNPYLHPPHLRPRNPAARQAGAIRRQRALRLLRLGDSRHCLTTRCPG
jgi:hypothetical protein